MEHSSQKHYPLDYLFRGTFQEGDGEEHSLNIKIVDGVAVIEFEGDPKKATELCCQYFGEHKLVPHVEPSTDQYLIPVGLYNSCA